MLHLPADVTDGATVDAAMAAVAGAGATTGAVLAVDGGMSGLRLPRAD